MTHTLYLVRHATPDWSRTDLPYHLPPGPPLTAQGEAEAVETAAFLRTAGLRAVFTSPLERCQRTADIISGVCGLTPQVHPALAEMHPGEGLEVTLARVWPLWEMLTAPEANPAPVALVTHGGPTRAVLEKLGADPALLERYRRVFDRGNPVPPAGVWRVHRTETGWSAGLHFTPAAYRKLWML